MAAKNKIIKKPVKKAVIQKPQHDSFMGLTKSQTQSLSIGIIFVGLGLFILAAFAYKSTEDMILSDGAKTYNPPATAITPTNFIVDSMEKPTAMAAKPSEAPGVQVSPTTMPTMTIAPTVQATPTAMPTAMTANPSPKPVAMVKKLPNTSSKVTYTVMDNDNIAKIGKKLCGSDRAWLSIVETNNIPYPYTIHSGETYIITCN